MRLGIQLLKGVSSVNDYEVTRQLRINRGETFDVYFQLIDQDRGGLRYMPASGSTVFVELPLFEEAFPTTNNVRDLQDNSIRRNADQPFTEDASIWRLPLVADDTLVMTTTSMRVTLTEGSDTKITVLDLALVVGPEEKGLLP